MKKVISFSVVLLMLMAMFVPVPVAAAPPPETVLPADETYHLEYQPPLDDIDTFYHSEIIDGVFWEVFRTESSAGTGTFNPFVRFDAPKDGYTRAYNTDGVVEFQTKDDPHTHSITLAEIPFGVKMSGDAIIASGREFIIDVNEKKNTPTMVLDVYQVWLTSNPAITGYDVVSGTTSYSSIWTGTDAQWVGEIDWNFQVGNTTPAGAINRQLVMDYRVNKGSGWGDYRVLIPDHYFMKALDIYNAKHPAAQLTIETAYMVLYVEHYNCDDGFEEWGVREQIPATKSGTKFNDYNANGIRETSEPGLEGWTIYVDYNDNDILDIGEPSGVTGPDGTYFIEGIYPGNWKVKEVQQDAWIQTLPGEAEDYCYLEVFLSGEDMTGNDFGNFLIDPEINIVKTGDPLSKIGDMVDYTITVQNLSISGTPDISIHITDEMLGIDETIIMATGDPDYIITVAGFEIPSDAADPFVNTVYAEATCDHLAHSVTDSAIHTVNLFQPEIAVTKTGIVDSKIGDTVTFVIEFGNNSSSDTPDMEFEFDDQKLSTSGAFTLSSGATKIITISGFEIPDTQDDPYVNTVYVTASPIGFDNVYFTTASWSTNLFQPEINVTKTGNELSKIGDTVTYVITLENKSSLDTPDMEFEYYDEVLSEGGFHTLSAGAVKVITLAGFVIPEGADDPFVNTVYVTASPIGFPNVYTDSAMHSTNLFQPEISVTKTGISDSKIGDKVNYVIEFGNNSSSDTPDMAFEYYDEKVSTSGEFMLSSGATKIITISGFEIPEGAGDPFVNTVYVTASPIGFENEYTTSASWSTNLFQPEINVTKTGVELSKIGDTVDYVITFGNNSSGDTPDMEFEYYDEKMSTSGEFTLSAGATKIINISGFEIPEDASDPFVNTVIVTASPIGFDNIYTTSAIWETELFQPSIEITKTGDLIGTVGEPIHYSVVVENTSSSDSPNLIGTLSDSLVILSASQAEIDLAPGETKTVEYTYTPDEQDQNPLINTATVTTNPDGFTNVISAQAIWEVELAHKETAWGYNEGIAKDFLDSTVFDNPEFNNWGWSNGPIDTSSDGAIELRLLAGAGTVGGNSHKKSSTSSGVDVGTVTISWSAGQVTVTYDVDDPYILDGVHLWVGNDLLPRKANGLYTNSPGQFPYDGVITNNSCVIQITEPFTGDIYIAAHAVVIVPGD